MPSSQSLMALVLSTLLLGSLQAQTLTGTFQSKSIIIGTAQGPNNLSVAFTTPSTITSRNPQLPFNGEFMSSDDPAVQFLSYWVLFNAGTAVDLGILGFASGAIALDSDGNGIPDFAERQLAANAVGSIATISHVTGASSTGTITLTRSAGRETGTAVARFSSGNVFTGTWTIPILDVSGSYDATQRTFRLRASSSVWAPGTMKGSYTRVSDDLVGFSNIVYQLDRGPVITCTPLTFTRFGKSYRAIVEFLDFNILDNTFPDFQRWTLQITDPNDSDANGIPDLSDSVSNPPTVSAQPQSQTVIQGASVSFTVVASGAAPLNYQWRFNGKIIPTSIGPSLTLTNVTTNQIGNYSVVVSNSAGQVTSDSAALAVEVVPLTWDFAYSFGNVFAPEAETYVVEKTNLLKVDERPTFPISYWCPLKIEQDSRLTMRFDFPVIASMAHLKCAGLNVFNFGGGNYGSASFWASSDGTTWVQLLNAPTSSENKGYSYDSLLPLPALGTRSLWLQARLKASGAQNMAQFLRNSFDSTQKCFELKVSYGKSGFLRVTRFSKSAVDLSFSGRVSSDVKIYASTNLIDWALLNGFPNPQGALEFRDTTAGSFAQRFYRAIAQ